MTDQGANSRQALPGRRLPWSRSDCLALTVLLGAWGVWLTWQAATLATAPAWPPIIDPAKVQSVREKIDPNTASAASLRRLPLIGPAKAEAIIAYREAHRGWGGRVFASAKDLEKVRGIGPVIVRRASRHMVFQMTNDE